MSAMVTTPVTTPVNAVGGVRGLGPSWITTATTTEPQHQSCGSASSCRMLGIARFCAGSKVGCVTDQQLAPAERLDRTARERVARFRVKNPRHPGCGRRLGSVLLRSPVVRVRSARGEGHV